VLRTILSKKYLNVLGTWYVSVTLFIIIKLCPLFDYMVISFQAAVEISCEPSIKKYVRSYFIDHAVVSTSPTADGNITIDLFHQFSGLKWLREKPLSKFEDAQWLLIQKAEEEKLIQVTIKLPEEYLNKLTEQFNELYFSDSVSKSAQLWNEQRKLILHDAFFRFLLPSMEKEARGVLANKAKHWVLMEYGKALWNKVSVGPYQQKENDHSSDDEAAPRVMACSWGPGTPQTTFVMLDSSGEVQDVLHTGSLTLKSQNPNDQQRKKNDLERLLKFMTDHQPHVIVLGAANLSCTGLKEDIYEVVSWFNVHIYILENFVMQYHANFRLFLFRFQSPYQTRK
jgi:transcription elongation factor SPT6